MADTWHITTQLTAAHYDEAMRTADMHQRQSPGAVNWIAYILIYGLGSLGGAAFVLAVADGDLRDGVTVVPGLATLGFMATLGGLIAIMRWSELRAARTLEKHRFNEPQSVEISPSGVSFTADSSNAQYGWAVVDAVLEGPNVIVIFAANVAIPVPRDSFPDPSDARAAFAQMQRWQEAAR